MKHEQSLTVDELKLIQRALAAAADGPFFDDDEFHTLFGMSRDELKQARVEWSVMEAPVESLSELQWAAALGALVQLWGYPHAKYQMLPSWVGVPAEGLRPVIERLKAVGRRPS